MPVTATPTAAPTPKPTPKPTPVPAPAPKSSESLNTNAVPFVPEQSSQAAQPSPTTDLAKISERYRQLKEKALQDKHVLALRDKSDAATDEAEMAKTSRAYYKALFAKMRRLDPSMSDYINRVEAATMRGLESPSKANQ